MYRIQTKDEYLGLVNAKRGAPVIVKFEAPWCQPCKTLDPILDNVARELEKAMYFFKIDIDVIPDICAELGIRTVPTLIKFEDGEAIDRRVGVGEYPDYIEWLS